MLRGSMPEKPFLNCNYTRKINFFSFSDSAKMKILDIWFATCLAFLYVTTNLKVLRHSCVCANGITSFDIEISIIAIARKGSISRRLIQQDQRKCNLSIGVQMLFLELRSLRHVSFIYIGIGNQNCYYQSFYWDPFSLPLPSPFFRKRNSLSSVWWYLILLLLKEGGGGVASHLDGVVPGVPAK